MKTAVVAALALAGALAQRDAMVTPAGTASIAGRVMTEESPPRPVRRAIVTLTGSELRPNRGAITDDDGRFAFTSLPPGRFALTAARASFVTSAFGATRPGRPGTAIAVATGQSLRDLTITLWRGAAIAGVLRDETGVPASGIPVTAVPARAAGPALTLSTNGAVTNDLGEFRIFGLEPGDYVVMAKPTATSGTPTLTMSTGEIDALFDALRRGGGRASASRPARASATETTQRVADYTTIYFPGTSSQSQARRITLAAGDEQTGLDFTLQRGAATFVEGIVSRPDGQPAGGASLQLTARRPARDFSSITPVGVTTTAAADGTFRIASVQPGDYRLVALAPPSLWAATELSVGGSDLKQIALTVEPGPTLSGRVQLDGQTSPSLTKLRVALLPTSIGVPRPGTQPPLTYPAPVTVRDDGTFVMTNVPPDTFRLWLVGPPLDAGWWAASAMLGSHDLLDSSIVVTRGANLTGIVVTLSDRVAELSGTFSTADGAPAANVYVIGFSADPAAWGPGARRVQAVRPAVDGRFAMTLPPGDYLIGAVTDADPDDWQDPAFLQRLTPASIKVSIAAGEKKVQDIRIR